MADFDPASLWSSVLDGLVGRIASQTIANFLKPLVCLDAASDRDGGVLLLQASNDFAREWAARHYGALIEEQLRNLTGIHFRVQWTVNPEAAPPPPPPPAPRRAPPAAPRKAIAARTATVPAETPSRGVPRAAAPAASPSTPPPPSPSAFSSSLGTPTPPSPARTLGAVSRGLHPKYTFETFVVGPSNQLAHAAALAMVEPGGRRINPLFLCGASGLGKTHLVNAVGHRLLGLEPGATVIYVSAEHFTNEFIAALQSRTMDDFRARYRNGCQALLLDDIQFFAGKEQTLDEFFHTFNALFLRDCPIVLTSDVAPQALQGMPDRLVSRFASGLVAEVYAPELETRVAILRTKAELEGIRLDDEAAFALASAVSSNVRELEGVLMKLAVKASLARRTQVDVDLVRDALRLPLRAAVVTIEDIQRAVCEHFKIKLGQLTGKERTQEVALPRQVAMYLCRERLGSSFPQIGARFGGKDHTTVMAAVKKIEKLVAEQGLVVRDVESIAQKLGPSLPAGR